MATKKVYTPREYDPEFSFPEFPSVITEDIGCYRHGIYPLGKVESYRSSGGYEIRSTHKPKVTRK